MLDIFKNCRYHWESSDGTYKLLDKMKGVTQVQDYSRRHFLKAVAGGGIALSTMSLPPGLAGSRRKPNIVFIIADDMKKHMFNCLPEGKGRNLSPNIDRLAAEGTLLMGQMSFRLCARPVGSTA
jgi:hypothetical protein